MDTQLKIEELDAFNDYKYSSKYCRACIGRNGLLIDKDISIFYGYYEAVELLFKNIENANLTVDTAIYPFMFCCRHAIELILKQIIHKLILITSIKTNIKYENIYQTYKKDINKHSLKKLAENLKILSSVDKRLESAFTNELKDIDKLLSELYEDEKSDKYRYAYNNDNQLNLDGKYLLAADIIYKKFQKTSNLLEKFFYLSNDLLEEYQIGTFTEKLSRKEIKEISEILPIKELWITDLFTSAKNTIMNKYGLTNRKFSKTVDIIKNHREFSANIGEEMPFKSFEKDTLRKTAELIKLSEAYDSTLPSDLFFSKDKKEEQKYIEKSLLIIKTIPTEDLILLLTFININDNMYYSEKLDKLYDYHLKNITRDDEYFLNKCFYCKYDELLDGFNKCGQSTYATKLTNYYQNISRNNN